MSDKTTFAGRGLFPALFACAFLAAPASAWADEIGRPGANNGPPVGIVPVSIKLQTVFDAADKVGYDFLQYFNVYLDYPHHQIYLEPNDVYKRSIRY